VIAREAARAGAPLRHIARLVEGQAPWPPGYVDRIEERLGPRVEEPLDWIKQALARRPP
jgi:hypothetical protein